MGIYYFAVFDDDTYIKPPEDNAIKFPGIVHAENPFAQICMLKVYRDHISYRIVDDVGSEYDTVVEHYKNETEKWFEEWKKIWEPSI